MLAETAKFTVDSSGNPHLTVNPIDAKTAQSLFCTPDCGLAEKLMTIPPTDNAPVSGVPGERALILVVERNPSVQRLEKYFLEQAGYTVEFANDGVSALSRAQELKPKILVTEILVPKLDGLSLCRALKSNPKTSKILVLIFSHLQAQDRATEVGADAFLDKPLEEELLIETVERLIAQHGMSAKD
jgi:CheY-like chemotaxis protein